MSSYSQSTQAKPLGWDLTFETIFDQNKVAASAQIRESFRKSNSHSIYAILKAVPVESVRSAVLIDRPSLGSNGITSLLFISTTKSVSVWEIKSFKIDGVTKSIVAPRRFNKMLKSLNRIEQGTPVSSKSNRSNWEGFWGILSTYSKGESRQILLTLEDLYASDNEPSGPGRVAAAVDEALLGAPELFAFVFRSCERRPTRLDFTTVYGNAVGCGREFGAELIGSNSCYMVDGRPLRASFNEKGRVMSLYMPRTEEIYSFARVIPTGSWLEYTRYRNKRNQTIQIPHMGASEATFRDECITIRRVTFGSFTDYTPGYTLVNWN